ncbi:hypothetical protein VPH35_108853 [Triticum aestivum]
MHYYLTLFGSSDNVLRALKRSFYLLTSDLEGVVKPNLALLRECELGACDIAKLCTSRPGLLSTNPERFRGMVACAKNMGVPCGSGMFGHALHAVACFSKEEIAARVDCLKNTFMWTDAEVAIAVSKAPLMLTRSKESMQRSSEFLISEVGLEPAYIARRPAVLTYSLKGRLRPRYYAVKFLKENGLLNHDRDYYSPVLVSNNDFMKKYICPHKEAAPHLAEDYAAACRGEVPARFIFA